MINKVTKKVIKEVDEVISSEFVCDVCGKKGVYENSSWRDVVGNQYEESHYYSIFTGHRDWGNDSGDSEETKQACCTECLLKIFTNWLNDDFFTSSDTAFIHIDKEKHIRGKEKNNEGL